MPTDEQRHVHDEAIEVRLSALERHYDRMYELVEGQHPWSHRKRLHALENNDRAASLAAAALEAHNEALKAHDEARDNRWVKFREWGAFALALAALIITNLH